MLWFFDNNKFPWQLTARQRKFIQENSIFINLLIFLSSMFEYKDFNPELNTDFIEFYNILTPRAASGVFKNKDGKEVSASIIIHIHLNLCHYISTLSLCIYVTLLRNAL